MVENFDELPYMIKFTGRIFDCMHGHIILMNNKFLRHKNLMNCLQFGKSVKIFHCHKIMLYGTLVPVILKIVLHNFEICASLEGFSHNT